MTATSSASAYRRSTAAVLFNGSPETTRTGSSKLRENCPRAGHRGQADEDADRLRVEGARIPGRRDLGVVERGQNRVYGSGRRVCLDDAHTATGRRQPTRRITSARRAPNESNNMVSSP